MAVLDTHYNPPLGFDTSTAGLYLRKGLEACGLTDYGYSFEDFTSPTLVGWTATNTAGGSAATDGSADVKAGRWTFINSATINSVRSDTGGLIVSNLNSDRWYHAARFKMTTAPIDATVVAGSGFSNGGGTATLLFGLIGPLSTANFIVQYDGNLTGTAMSLGVASNSSFNIFEMWGVGTSTVYARCNGGAIVSAVMASAPTVAVKGYRYLGNGANGAAHQLNFDWSMYIYPR